MSSPKTIQIQVNENGMWGNTNLGTVDVQASLRQFEQMIVAQLLEEYPGAEVKAEVIDRYNTLVHFDRAFEDHVENNPDNRREWVKYTVESIWCTEPWIVEQG